MLTPTLLSVETSPAGFPPQGVGLYPQCSHSTPHSHLGLLPAFTGRLCQRSRNCYFYNRVYNLVCILESWIGSNPRLIRWYFRPRHWSPEEGTRNRREADGDEQSCYGRYAADASSIVIVAMHESSVYTMYIATRWPFRLPPRLTPICEVGGQKRARLKRLHRPSMSFPTGPTLSQHSAPFRLTAPGRLEADWQL